MHPGDCMHPGDHVHPGALTPACCRGSMLTVIGTHLDSVYRAKIHFEASGVRTEAMVSAGAGGRHPPDPALPAPIPWALCRTGAQHPAAHRIVRPRRHQSGCCATAQPSPSKARWRQRQGT